MKVSFVLPQSGQNPMGGFKVVYTYANGLAARGHEVTVVHAPYRQRGDRSFFKTAKQVAAFTGRKLGLKGGYRPDAWFQVDPRVHLRWVPSLHSSWVPDSDAVVATAWLTSEWVSAYPERKGHKFYLIQGQETIFQGVDQGRVMETWKLPMKKIVVSRWLKDMAISLGESATCIPNGVDLDDFGIDIPLLERDPWKLIMLYHHQMGKGSEQGLDAMRAVRQKVPQLEATLFGVPERPKNLPCWISYWQKPNRSLLRRLYNEAAIFVGPSWSEGWPLPPSEAALCGAALCLTDIGGHREYTAHEQTALLSPPKDAKALAANIMRFVEDKELRIRIAEQGHKYVQQFTWARAINAFEQTLQEGIN